MSYLCFLWYFRFFFRVFSTLFQLFSSVLLKTAQSYYKKMECTRKILEKVVMLA